MDIAILRIGRVDEEALENIRLSICEAFPATKCYILEEVMSVPQDAYNPRRRQYHSSYILREVYRYATGCKADCILGVTEVDLYVPHFVFGEAHCPGRTAIVSLCRLRPEFYGQPVDRELFILRSMKEAVHEVGHAAFGLTHCSNPSCVMCFSNSIIDVDRKTRFLCKECKKKVEKSV